MSLGRRLDILMVLENHSYPEDVRVRNEARALCQAGHRLTVIAPRAGSQQRWEVVEGVCVRRFRVPRDAGSIAGLLMEYLIAHVQIYRLAISRILRGVDVLHAHNPPDTMFPLGVAVRALGGHFVYDHHDLTPELFGEKFGERRAVTSALLALQKASLRLASKVIVTNESQREIAVQRGAVAENVTVVRNGPRATTIRSSRDGRLGALVQPRLVFLGALERQDGVMLLPELLENEALSSARLTLVGSGSTSEELAREFATRGLSDRVTFTGWIPHDQVPGILAASDICVDVAPEGPLNHASTMIKIGEYLAAGRPVVAFALRETRRTLGGAGITVPGGDVAALASAIADLAADPIRRGTLESEALARCKELVWERSEAGLLRTYGELGRSTTSGARGRLARMRAFFRVRTSQHE